MLRNRCAINAIDRIESIINPGIVGASQNLPYAHERQVRCSAEPGKHVNPVDAIQAGIGNCVTGRFERVISRYQLRTSIVGVQRIVVDEDCPPETEARPLTVAVQN